MVALACRATRCEISGLVEGKADYQDLSLVIPAAKAKIQQVIGI
jgi:hypothetical protein